MKFDWVLTTYALLSLTWLVVMIRAIVSNPGLEDRRVRRLKWISAFLAFCLLLDSAYWTVVYAAEHGLNIPSPREPGFVIAIKLLVLIAAIAFMFILSNARKALNEKLETAYFSRLIDHTWDAIGLLDEHARVRLWNSKAVDLFQFQKNDITGRSILDFFVPKSRKQEVEEMLRRVKSNRKAETQHNTSRLTQSGKEIEIDIAVSP
ncbi:MAG: PAS domain-containing protein, partial [Pseudomonadota bacterium]